LYRYSVLSQIKTSGGLLFLWGLSSKALSHAVSPYEFVLCIFSNTAACVCVWECTNRMTCPSQFKMGLTVVKLCSVVSV